MIEPTESAAHIHPAVPGEACRPSRAHRGRPIVRQPRPAPDTTMRTTVDRSSACPATVRTPVRIAAIGDSSVRGRAPGSGTRAAAKPATSVATAWSAIANVAPTSVTASPASAGPATNAASNVMLSAAFAWSHSRRGTSTGTSDRNPTVGTGNVTPSPARRMSSATTGVSASSPRAMTAPRIAARAMTVMTMTRRRLDARSSHAPTNGPDAMPGRSCAAAPAPATAGLPVRSRR